MLGCAFTTETLRLAKEQGLSRSLVFANGLRFSCKKQVQSRRPVQAATVRTRNGNSSTVRSFVPSWKGVRKHVMRNAKPPPQNSGLPAPVFPVKRAVIDFWCVLFWSNHPQKALTYSIVRIVRSPQCGRSGWPVYCYGELSASGSPSVGDGNCEISHTSHWSPTW